MQPFTARRNAHSGRGMSGGARRRLLLAVGAAGMVVWLSSCGSTSTTPTPSGRVRPGSSATPFTSKDPGDPTLLPAPADVPFAQAPSAVQNEWRQYYATGAITVVPNSTVPYMRPTTPQVANATNGAVDNATAQRWGDALVRENAWENWAITANQVGLFDNSVISSSQAEPGLVLPQGATGFRIVGERWPMSLRLVPVPSSSQTFLHDSDEYAYILAFKRAWSVESLFPNGTTQPIADQMVSAGARFVVIGRLKQLQDFGELWYASASFACDSSEPQPVLSLCAE